MLEPRTTSDGALPVDVSLIVPGADDEELAEHAWALRAELTDLGVEASPLPAAAPAPAGAKTGEAFTVGALALAVLPALLPKVLDFLRHWLDRDRARGGIRIRLGNGSAEVEVELTATDRSLEEALAAASLALERTSPPAQGSPVSNVGADRE